jgi:hypothetical protein
VTGVRVGPLPSTAGHGQDMDGHMDGHGLTHGLTFRYIYIYQDVLTGPDAVCTLHMIRPQCCIEEHVLHYCTSGLHLCNTALGPAFVGLSPSRSMPPPTGSILPLRMILTQRQPPVRPLHCWIRASGPCRSGRRPSLRLPLHMMRRAYAVSLHARHSELYH